MFKTIVVGTLLLLIMATAAITATRGGIPQGVPPVSAEWSAKRDQHFAFRVRASANQSTFLSDLFGEFKEAITTTLGVTFVLCFAVGFWKHHQILTERAENEDPGATAEQRLNSDQKRC